MSRSYKKNPFYKDQSLRKFGKKMANRRVRAYLKDFNNVVKFKNYRKVYNSWDIHDFIFYETKKDIIRRYERDLKEYKNNIYVYDLPSFKEPNLNEMICDWEKYYRRK